MKRIATLLLIIILATITCSSSNTLIITPQDSIVSITAQQLKYTNLIFIEHKKLLEENSLLCKQINNYQLKVKTLEQIDSIRKSQIISERILYENQIKDLTSKKNKTITLWKIGGITVSASLVLLLLLK